MNSRWYWTVLSKHSIQVDEVGGSTAKIRIALFQEPGDVSRSRAKSLRKRHLPHRRPGFAMILEPNSRQFFGKSLESFTGGSGGS